MLLEKRAGEGSFGRSLTKNGIAFVPQYAAPLCGRMVYCKMECGGRFAAAAGDQNTTHGRSADETQEMPPVDHSVIIALLRCAGKGPDVLVDRCDRRFVAPVRPRAACARRKDVLLHADPLNRDGDLPAKSARHKCPDSHGPAIAAALSINAVGNASNWHAAGPGLNNGSMKLAREYIEKPWGRTSLPPMFDAPPGERIGEIWFTGDSDLPLLAKYIFTSERLSIQVHPDDVQAAQRGLRSGKTECWYILDAEPGATIGLGLTRTMEGDDLRAAALDGSIERLIDWRSVSKGDFILVPPGTVHAIGAGVALLEFQQNADVTYRLYDYGRARELHLDDGIEVATAAPFDNRLAQHLERGEERLLVDASPFRLIATANDTFLDQRRWVMPIEGEVQSNDAIAHAGDCLVVEAGAEVLATGAWMLIGTTI